ncbi:MAG: aminotransferase class V-fold PLP-dependent enzyme [Gammaproteobacteria bacterium]|nr:aminotransferase class V-fold PLP-dependent enzyme [Gammaproteobacteria bacterium]
MKALHQDVDPDGLLEYSVVYTDRALNHMSQTFQAVMCDISAALKQTYLAHSAVVVPGSGSFGMEAVARQFGIGANCLVLRNGWFSYRWSQILDAGGFAGSVNVLKARRKSQGDTEPFFPAALDEVLNTIKREKPDLVFAPHVETSAGMLLPDDYLKAVADAVHEQGGLFVLDCIASGCLWVDMEATGVDVLISAPQKGWSGPPCCGLVMLSQLARERIESTSSNSFSIDLKKWLSIMETYEGGGHAYHATMPTESLRQFRNVMQETIDFGSANAKQKQQELGGKIRVLLEDKGFCSVAGSGFQSPGVVVSYTDNASFQNGSDFAKIGMQIAAGVPLMCDEGEAFSSFRIGLFGLDKLMNVDRSVQSMASALDKLGYQ